MAIVPDPEEDSLSEISDKSDFVDDNDGLPDLDGAEAALPLLHTPVHVLGEIADASDPFPAIPSFTIQHARPTLLTFLQPDSAAARASTTTRLVDRLFTMAASTSPSSDPSPTSIDLLFQNLMNMTLQRIDDDLILEQTLSRSMDTYYDELFRKDGSLTTLDLSRFHDGDAAPAAGGLSTACAICLEDLDETAATTMPRIRLQCGHTIHDPCLKEYLCRRNRMCPVCRHPLDYLLDPAPSPDPRMSRED